MNVDSLNLCGLRRLGDSMTDPEVHEDRKPRTVAVLPVAESLEAMTTVFSRMILPIGSHHGIVSAI